MLDDPLDRLPGQAQSSGENVQPDRSPVCIFEDVKESLFKWIKTNRIDPLDLTHTAKMLCCHR